MGSTAASSHDPKPAIVEAEPPTPEQVALAEMLVDALKELDEVQEKVDRLRAMINDEIPLGTIVDLGDVYVVRGERRPNRKLNVVELLKRGVPREAFSTVKPSVTKFTEWAEKENWPESTRDMYIMAGGEPVQTVSVRAARSPEEDADNTEEN